MSKIINYEYNDNNGEKYYKVDSYTKKYGHLERNSTSVRDAYMKDIIDAYNEYRDNLIY